MKVNNIYKDLPESKKEIFEDIIDNKSFKLERIISRGQSSPDGDDWFNQDNDEWVILLKGSAGLKFEGEDEITVMQSGDYIHIPAHKRHKVEWTDKNQETIWLALHY